MQDCVCPKNCLDHTAQKRGDISSTAKLYFVHKFNKEMCMRDLQSHNVLDVIVVYTK